jgi:predicted metal-dependent hydrolase
VYTLILERLERHVLAERHVAAVMRAAGAKGGDVPTCESERARLDRLLDDRPRRAYPPEQAALIAALGLGG